MKRLLPCLVLCASLSAFAQDQTSSCVPHDSNGDNIIGVSDLMDLLARFGDSDIDEDGVWDSEDDCVGIVDECGVCNGAGPNMVIIDTILVTYDSIYVDQIDFWYVFVVDSDTLFTVTCDEDEAYCSDMNACNWQLYEDCDYSCVGCMDPAAANFNPFAETSSNCLFCDPGTFTITIEIAINEESPLTGVYSISEIGNSSIYAEGLFESSISDGTTAYEGVCIPPGCYVLSYNIDGNENANSVSVYDQFGTSYAENYPSMGAVIIDFGTPCD